MDSRQKGVASAIQDVEQLHVFRKAYAISLEVHRISLGYPKLEQWALADQMRIWASYSHDLGYLDAAMVNAWREEYRTIAKMLVGLHSKWGRDAAS